MKFIMSLLVLILPLSSWGVKWIERGNGGFVLRCPGKATETFDIYEARSRYGLTLDTSHSASVEERVQYLISKLEAFNPSRAVIYNQWAWDFDKESRRIDNVEMFPVPDLGFGARPRDCKLELTVFQREPDILNRSRYSISQDLWNELDTLNKAALIVHEIIYRELSSVKDFTGTSEAARYLNGILNSAEFGNLKHSDYLVLLQSLGFRNADYGGYNILLNLDDPKLNFKLQFHEAGGLVGAYLDPSNHVYPTDLPVHSIGCYQWDSYVSFYPHGKTQSLLLTYFDRKDCVPFYEFTRPDSRISFQAHSWKFHPNGKIMSLKGNIKSVLNPKDPLMLIKGIPFIFNVGNIQSVIASAQFDSDGELLTIDLDRYASCYDPSRARVVIEPPKGASDYVLNFDIRNLPAQLKTMALCRGSEVRK